MEKHRFIIKAFDFPGSVPIGYIPEGGFIGDVIPPGWIEVTGQNVEDLKEYPDLYNALKEAGIKKLPDIKGVVVDGKH